MSRRYDAFVAFQRRTLPATAALMAIITISWPLLNQKETSFVLSRERMTDSDGRVRMVNVHYEGVDDRQRPFSVSSSYGVQRNPNAPTIRLSGLDARIDLSPERHAEVAAQTGVYHLADRRLEVDGVIDVRTSDGYRLNGRQAIVDLNRRQAESTAAVSGRSPLGDISAGGFRLNLDSGVGEFIGGVTLHVIPGAMAQSLGDKMP